MGSDLRYTLLARRATRPAMPALARASCTPSRASRLPRCSTCASASASTSSPRASANVALCWAGGWVRRRRAGRGWEAWSSGCLGGVAVFWRRTGLRGCRAGAVACGMAAREKACLGSRPRGFCFLVRYNNETVMCAGLTTQKRLAAPCTVLQVRTHPSHRPSPPPPSLNDFYFLDISDLFHTCNSQCKLQLATFLLF